MKIDYKVYQFRNGQKRCNIGGWDCREAAINWAINYSELSDGIVDVVETDIHILANPPSNRGRTNLVKHTLAHLEHAQQDTLFVHVVEWSVFRQKSEEADNRADIEEAALQQIIQDAIKNHCSEVCWDDLPDRWKLRITRTQHDCWLWHKVEKPSQYRNVYTQMKGQIPAGAVVRHNCDDRRCVNPNHLTLGTARDNVNDMVERKRHWRQKLRMAREAREAGYRRWRAAQKLKKEENCN